MWSATNSVWYSQKILSTCIIHLKIRVLRKFYQVLKLIWTLVNESVFSIINISTELMFDWAYFDWTLFETGICNYSRFIFARNVSSNTQNLSFRKIYTWLLWWETSFAGSKTQYVLINFREYGVFMERRIWSHFSNIYIFENI